MSNREVVVVSGARTAIGDYGGALKELAATRLGHGAITTYATATPSAGWAASKA